MKFVSLSLVIPVKTIVHIYIQIIQSLKTVSQNLNKLSKCVKILDQDLICFAFH